jgi:(p)ppGpp synthase/HD superfamily hydrolase
MKINGHELEPGYISQIIELKRAEKRPRVTDVFWVKKFRRKLRKRLEQLEIDFDNGLVSDKAYMIWKKMINEVL